MSNDTDRTLLERAELLSLLSYDPETGIFVWLKSNSNAAPVGAMAGRSTISGGYRKITIRGRSYKAHRLAWLYMHGSWPDQIDHINGDRSDNRICNLRNVTSKLNTQNQRNPQRGNQSGFLGVSKRTDGKFQAEIRVDGKKRYLGTYRCPEQASQAYIQAKRQLHKGSTV